MSRTFFLRGLKKELSIREKMSRPTPLFDKDSVPDNLRTRRWKLKHEAERYMKSGDHKKAEKKLLKMLRINSTDHYALSKLIATYTRQGRFDDGKNLYKAAEKRHADGSVIYTSAIVLYYKAGELDNACRVFETAVERKCADYATYSAMLNIYIDLGQADEVKNILGLACKNTTMLSSLFSDTFDFYFNRGLYQEAIDMIENSHSVIRESPRMKLALMEIHRKMKNYDTAIECAEKFISEYPEKDFDDDNYIQAHTIKAYCMIHSGMQNEAADEFSLLIENVSRNNIHYPRILCGFVFCKPALTGEEREHLLADLDYFGVAAGASMQDKIENAMKILSSDR